jgi:RHS repeat-associated protein
MPFPTTVLYRRDLLGRVVAAGDATSPALYGAWSYRADGALATETLGTGAAAVTRSFAYDGLGRPASIAEPAQDLSWSYRRGGASSQPFADGRIAAETVTYKPAAFPAGAAVPPGSTIVYAYDAAGRLISARSADRPALDQAASYDGDGNLTSLSAGSASQAYAYAAGTNRLAAVTPAGGAARAYAHDAAGRVAMAAGAALVRDPVSGQVRRATKGASSLAFFYDAGGRQVLATSGGAAGAKRLQLRDGAGAPLAEYEAQGPAAAALTLAHVPGATGRIAMWASGELYGISKDPRGSLRLAYLAGKAVASFAYRAYGTLEGSAASSAALTAMLRWRFTGQEWLEALGLYDYGARLYEPALGRFLSPDPAHETTSPYMYVGGDPVGNVDPDGRVFIGFVRGADGLLLAVDRELEAVRAFLPKTPPWKVALMLGLDKAPHQFPSAMREGVTNLELLSAEMTRAGRVRRARVGTMLDPEDPAVRRLVQLGVQPYPPRQNVPPRRSVEARPYPQRLDLHLPVQFPKPDTPLSFPPSVPLFGPLRAAPSAAPVESALDWTSITIPPIRPTARDRQRTVPGVAEMLGSPRIPIARRVAVPPASAVKRRGPAKSDVAYIGRGDFPPSKFKRLE